MIRLDLLPPWRIDCEVTVLTLYWTVCKRCSEEYFFHENWENVYKNASSIYTTKEKHFLYMSTMLDSQLYLPFASELFLIHKAATICDLCSAEPPQNSMGQYLSLRVFVICNDNVRSPL